MTAVVISLLFLVICLSVPTWAGQGPPKGLPPAWIEFPIVQGQIAHVDVYEQTVTWSQGAWSGLPPPCTLAETTLAELDWDICLYDTQTGEMSDTMSIGNMNQWPRLDGDWLVWRRGFKSRSVLAKNLVTGQEITLPRDPIVPQPDTPNIHGGLVVYRDFAVLPPDYDLAEKIVAYDLMSQQFITIAVSLDYYVNYPDVYSETVVWQQAPTATLDFDIVGYDLSSQNVFTISDRPGNELYPRIDGSVVVWDWNGDIYGYDLDAGRRLTITQAAGTQTWPAVSGNLVVWMDDRNSGQWDIYAYDLATGQEEQVTDSSINEGWPAVWGNLVAWDAEDIGVYAARRMTDFRFMPFVRQ